MQPQEVFDLLNLQFPDQGIEYAAQTDEGGDPFITVPGECLVAVCEFLKSDPRLDFKMCHCLSGVDYGDRLASVIHLYSIPLKHKIVVKTFCTKEAPHIPSVAEVWKGANWHERESFDLLGILYDGHPNLRRILLSDNWEGYPLRKDYQLPDDTLFPWEGDDIELPEPAPAAPARPTAAGSESAPIARPPKDAQD